MTGQIKNNLEPTLQDYERRLRVIQIPVGKGKFALVDADTDEAILRRKWRARFARKRPYVTANVRMPNGRYTSVPLHRMIMNAPAGADVDHISGDVLDNRKANLRICSRAENIRNSKKRAGTSSVFKGVCFDRSRGTWTAGIVSGAKRKNLGRFFDEVAAARAYDAAAKEMFGAYARLNFPNSLEAA